MSTINYTDLLKKNRWLGERNKHCVINADTDGFLCGLLTSHLLDWKIVGFYEGRVLLLDQTVKPKDCVYLDVEIYRRNIFSMGQHMVLYNKRHKPSTWDNFSSCINPNILRGFDNSSDFKRKYPFATVHLLISILNKAGLLRTINDASYPVLLFADGTYKNVLNYVENCLDWFQYLQIDRTNHVLHDLFFGKKYTLTELGRTMDSIFKTRNKFNASIRYIGGAEQPVRGARSGHNLVLTDNSGQLVNQLPSTDGSCEIYFKERDRVVGFIKFLSEVTGYVYNEASWSWKNLKVHLLNKTIIDGKKGNRMNIAKFKSIMEVPALSIANTGRPEWEYTEDTLAVFD